MTGLGRGPRRAGAARSGAADGALGIRRAATLVPAVRRLGRAHRAGRAGTAGGAGRAAGTLRGAGGAGVCGLRGSYRARGRSAEGPRGAQDEPRNFDRLHLLEILSPWVSTPWECARRPGRQSLRLLRAPSRCLCAYLSPLAPGGGSCPRGIGARAGPSWPFLSSGRHPQMSREGTEKSGWFSIGRECQQNI